MTERRWEGTLLTTAAQIVIRIRAERELTMSALAVLAGVPTSTISRIESRRVEPTLGMIRRIALGAGYHLHVQYDDLFSGSLEDGGLEDGSLEDGVVDDDKPDDGRPDSDMVQVAAGDPADDAEVEDELQ